jgi:uncharacterized membrane protein YfcA
VSLGVAFDLTTIVFFVVLSLGASTVNGGLGYGYSSISTPLALLFVVNRILNPAYALLEAVLNTFMLAVSGFSNIRSTARRTFPILVSLVPGVILGSLALNAFAPVWVRVFVYATLLPLILLQVAGYRRPISREGHFGVPLGAGIGFLYSLTTISGPPMALFLNNQGLPKEEFKASLAQVRMVESYSTCVAYYFLGLFSGASFQLFSFIAPPVALGIPLGMLVVRRVSVETFRRVCMSFDLWIVGYGLTRALMQQAILGISEAYADALWAGVIVVDVVLLYRFFRFRMAHQEILQRPRTGSIDSN